MPKKLFVFDMDGTLLNTDHKVSEVNFKALKAAKKSGHLLAIATGRPFAYAISPFARNNPFDYITTNDGSSIYIVKENKFIHTGFLDKNILIELLKISKEKKYAFMIFTEKDAHAFVPEDEISGDQEKMYPLIWGDNKIISEMELLKLIEKEKIVNCYLKGDGEKMILDYEHINKLFSDKFKILYFKSGYIISGIKNNNKFKSIQTIITKFENDVESIISFGDQWNDIELLENSDYSYAMENASEEAKNKAKAIIGNNDSDAIAKTIKKHI